MKRLTDTQKAVIQNLRGEGLGYKAIAANLGLSRETVRSFCARNHIPADPAVSTGSAANEAEDVSEIKSGNTVFLIKTDYSDHATETLKTKLEKLILDAARSYQFVQG